MSTILRWIPVLLMVAFTVAFLGFDCNTAPKRIAARHLHNGVYSVSLEDSTGGKLATTPMSIGDTPGGSGRTSIPPPDCTRAPYRPPYILLMAIGDTTPGQ